MATLKEALKLFAALSDPTRLRIVALLLERDLCVCELMFILNMSQSRISHQLRILRDAGLVVDKREGQWMIYGILPGLRDKLKRGLGLFGVTGTGKTDDIVKDLENLRLCLAQKVRKSGKAIARRKGDR
jgi:ArsR family transcriptional regulator, arsenate/arsenite/antimonite-responsive transcriptional repressor